MCRSANIGEMLMKWTPPALALAESQYIRATASRGMSEMISALKLSASSIVFVPLAIVLAFLDFSSTSETSRLSYLVLSFKVVKTLLGL
jgi:hypothetical protein